MEIIKLKAKNQILLENKNRANIIDETYVGYGIKILLKIINKVLNQFEKYFYEK